jgi:hypothetical protein
MRCNGCRREEGKAGCAGLVDDARRRVSHCRPRSVWDLQEYDLSLVYASAASTNNGAGGGLEGRRAGWGKQAIETNHEL